MEFTKMHGAGNDYIYVDARNREEDWPAISAKLSDRHTGIGADGLILALESDHADLRMRMFNADGSEAEMCGNGIRCLVGYALTRGIVPRETSPVHVESLAGDLEVTPTWDRDKVVWARVSMGEPRLAVEDIPVALEDRAMLMDYPLTINGVTFEINAVSMGNPHAVAFIDEPVDDIPLFQLGPLVEHHPLFPNRVNFEIVNVIDEEPREGACLGTRLRGDHGMCHRSLRGRSSIPVEEAHEGQRRQDVVPRGRSRRQMAGGGRRNPRRTCG